MSNKDGKHVIYFSPTGGCRAIAEAIASVREELIDITLPEARAEKIEFDADEKYVFVFPVYNRNIPDVCADYIKRSDGRNARAVVICVYGGVTKGRSLENAAGLLAARNFRPEFGAYVPAPHFYSSVKYNLIGESRSEGVSAFVNGENAVTKTLYYARPARKSAQKLMKSLTGKCAFDSSRCTSCGACSKICPVGAIDASLKTSDKDCILCGACADKCPSGARKIKFASPLPLIFIGAKMRERDTEFYILENKLR